MEVTHSFGCPLCLDILHDPVLTPCNHSFCRTCISRACSSGHSCCPVCRGSFQGFDPHAVPSNTDLAAQIASTVPTNMLAQRTSQAQCVLGVVVNNLHEQRPDCGAEGNKWTMWVSLCGIGSEHTATMIEKVVYQLPSTFTQRSVTTYPPFFSLCRAGQTAFTVGCQIHWNPMMHLHPTKVDHHLVFAPDGHRTVRAVVLDPVALDALELGALQHFPSSVTQLQLARRPSQANGMDTKALNALGLDVPRKQAASTLPLCSVPPDLGMSEQGSLFEVVVGNRYTALAEQVDGNPSHEWTMYVMLPGFQQASKSRIIERLVYKLHPTFAPDTYTRRSPTYELTCCSWDAFKVACTIHWNPALGSQPTTVVHDLIFDGAGGRTSATVSFNSRRLQFFV